MVSDTTRQSDRRRSPSSRVTMADVAREASVSKATVSMALRGLSEISAETRRYVVEVAGRLGYRADPSLSRIAASRWKARSGREGNAIAFLDCVRPEVNISRPSIYLEGARRRATEMGYGLERLPVSNPREMLQRARILYHRGVQSVILSGVFDPSLLEAFPWDHFVAVGVGGQACDLPVECCGEDSVCSIGMATAKVLQAGYRRIGLVLADDPEQASDNLVRESLFDALVARAGGSPVRPLRIRPGDTGGALADWCGQARPDAVIGYADGVLGQLESAGVIGSDGMGFAALQVARSGKEVAGIIDPSDSLGALSVELADEMLRRGRFGPLANRTIRNLAPIWKEGRSLPRSQTSAPVRVTFGPERIAAVS